MKAEAAAADADAGGGRRDSSAATCKRRSSASAAAEINPAELEQIEASREARRQGWLPSEGGDGGGGGGSGGEGGGGGGGRIDELQAEVAELRREGGESREMLGAIAGKLDQLLLAGAPLSA